MGTTRTSRWRTRAAVAVTAALALAAGFAAAPASAATLAAGDGHHGGTRYEHRVLAKAEPDECFAGVGLPYPAGPPCAEGQSKVNQSYVWGLTRVDKKLWFGTGANINCLTSGRNLHPDKPNHNEDWVCEYGESQVAKRNPNLPKTLGDHRPPRMYAYDTVADALIEKTDLVRTASEADARRLQTTAGIRAAGAHQGVVLFVGPALSQSINLFAFDSDTGGFLGSTSMTTYGNMRHFVVADGALYAGVGVGANGGERGHVLRWTGGKTDPFQFVPVANLPAQAADLAVHQGRIFVTTWIGSGDEGAAAVPAAGVTAADGVTAGVWMSPKLDEGERGLNPADADRWTQVWSVDEYEPDPLIARTYALGGLASFGGQLYWGTMHVPLKATTIHLATYPPTTQQAARDAVKYTQRAIAIFRGRDFGRPREQVELLYGAPELPRYDPSANGGTGAWSAGSTGYTPRYGSSGFGNKFLNYTWKMVVSDEKLYVGTMDWSYISRNLQPATLAQAGIPAADAAALTAELAAEDPPANDYGADLYVFDSPNKAARAVNTTGVGNYLNYGVRNMVADGSTVYLGMANPMNLRTDPDDDVPEGGWELIKLTSRRC